MAWHELGVRGRATPGERAGWSELNPWVLRQEARKTHPAEQKQ